MNPGITPSNLLVKVADRCIGQCSKTSWGQQNVPSLKRTANITPENKQHPKRTFQVHLPSTLIFRGELTGSFRGVYLTGALIVFHPQEDTLFSLGSWVLMDHFLTPTTTNFIHLFGLIVWCLEKSSKHILPNGGVIEMYHGTIRTTSPSKQIQDLGVRLWQRNVDMKAGWSIDHESTMYCLDLPPTQDAIVTTRINAFWVPTWTC